MENTEIAIVAVLVSSALPKTERIISGIKYIRSGSTPGKYLSWLNLITSAGDFFR